VTFQWFNNHFHRNK